MDETLRLLKAFKFTDEHGEVGGCGWARGAGWRGSRCGCSLGSERCDQLPAADSQLRPPAHAALRRVATALQVCPANWTEGGATIKPNPKDSMEYFAQQ